MPYKQKVLWVVGGGVESAIAIRQAHRMGLMVAVSDGDPNCPARPYADHFFEASTYDPAATVGAALNFDEPYPIDGVIALAADVPVTVSNVRHALHLPGLGLDVAHDCANKMQQWLRLFHADIPVPESVILQSPSHLDVVRMRAPNLAVKPVFGRGARGVIRLTDDISSEWAYHHATAESSSLSNPSVMAQEWIDGPQVSTESVVTHSWAETPGFIDRNYSRLEQFAPYVIEDGGQQPSVLDEDLQRRVREVAEQAARALGIINWTAKGDIVIHPKRGPMVIEMAARLSGGYMSSVQIPIATGVDMVGIAIRLALGEPVAREECQPKFHRGAAIRYRFPADGQVHNHTERGKHVITVGDTREEAVSAAEDAIRKME